MVIRLIEDGQNDYLIPSSSDHVEDQIKQAYAAKICQLYQENRLEGMRTHSYPDCRNCLTEEILEKWKKVLGGAPWLNFMIVIIQESRDLHESLK